MIGPLATLSDSRLDGDDATATVTETGATDPHPDDRYRVERELARGGRGRVWIARDIAMQRDVAIKQPARRGPSADARFEREARITGQLQHPAIVPVYEAGRWSDGSPYYTMKFVEGDTLGERIERARTAAERLALVPHVVAVADAAAYAHDRGVIHRDLKPANVVCGRFGETVVLDWGLARPTPAGDVAPPEPRDPAVGAALTVDGAVVGTPTYMAPEQARGEVVDARADVYAIGAILYHLIAGVPPYRGASSDVVIARVLDGPPPSLAGHGAPADLVAIADRAMARDAGRRYPSAGELAEDLRRFIAGRLVTAHAYSRRARLARWAVRHRAVVGLAATALAVIAVIAGVAIRRVVDERDAARTARVTADLRADALILAHAAAMLDHDPAATLAWLKTYGGHGGDSARFRALALDAESRGVARHVWRHAGGIGAFAASRSGAIVATGGDDRRLAVRDAATGRLIAELELTARVTGIAFFADERAVAAIDLGGSVHVLDLATRAARTVAVPGGALFGLVITADDSAVVAGGLGGAPVVVERATGAMRALGAGGDRITSLALADAATVVTGDSAGHVVAWRLAGDAPARALSRHDGAVDDIVVAGGVAISSGEDGTLRRAPIAAGRAPATTTMTTTALASVANDLALGPGDTLVLAGRDGHALVLGPGGAPITALALSEPGELIQVAWSRDGARVVGGVRDGRVVAWDVATGTAVVLARHGAGPVHVAGAADGSILAGGGDGVARSWSVDSDRGSATGRDHSIIYLAAARDGTLAASQVHGAIERVTAAGSTLLQRGDPAVAVAISGDGRRVWAATWDGAVRSWDAVGAATTLDTSGMTWALAVAGDRVVAAGAAGIRIWDGGAAVPRVLTGHRGDVRTVALAPDGAWIVSGGSDRTVRLWPLAAGGDAASRTLAVEIGEVYLVAWAPDGRHVASVTLDGVRLWSTADWSSRALVTPAAVRSIAFSPDGTRLAATTEAAALPLWDVATGARRDLIGPASGSNRLAFAPDGARFASTGCDGTVRVWDVARGLDRIVHRFGAEAYDVAWTTEIAASGGDRTLWRGSGAGPITGADRAAVAAVLARTTAVIDAGGDATTAPR